jgi:vancomycin resistance protein YoaR
MTSKKVTNTNINAESSVKHNASQSFTGKLFNKFKFKSKVFKIIFLMIGIIIVLFFIANLFFINVALPNSRLGNQDISYWTKNNVETYINDSINKYSISVKNQNQVTPVNIEDLGISFDNQKTLNDIFKSQNQNIINRLFFWKQKNYQFNSAVDNDRLTEFIKTYKPKIITKGKDAKISLKKGQVEVIPEVTQVEKSITNPSDKIMQSIKSGEQLELKVELIKTEPKVTSAKLTDLKTKLQNIINTKITLTVNKNKVQTTKEQRANLINIKAGKTDETAIKFDKTKTKSLLESIVKWYSKPPRPRVVYTNSSGQEKVLVNGEDGIGIANTQESIAQVINSLTGEKSTIIDLPLSYAKRSTIKAADYPKWIQVDLTNKRLYAYEHGKLVNQFLITAGAPATPTVVGEYKINYKVRKQTMRGLNTDGSRYTQPNVEWVNYFYADYAIHGNYWRPLSVFGNTNTSHGCVGLVNTNAKWVYDWAPTGTPVITHY